MERRPLQVPVHVVFEQFMASVRKQDDLVHSWVNILLVVQGGVATAYAYFLTLTGVHWFLTTLGSAMMAAMGWVTAYHMIPIIERENAWIGTYIHGIRGLPGVPDIFSEKPPSGVPGFTGRTFKEMEKYLLWIWGVAATVCPLKALLG